MSYNIAGLATTPSPVHGIHVHIWGNIGSPTGSGVSTHFIGGCDVTTCRPGATLQEVGYLFDGVGVTAGSGPSVAQRFDGVISLQGPLSIIGRSIIVHGNSTLSSPYVAQVGCQLVPLPINLWLGALPSLPANHLSHPTPPLSPMFCVEMLLIRFPLPSLRLHAVRHWPDCTAHSGGLCVRPLGRVEPLQQRQRDHPVPLGDHSGNVRRRTLHRCRGDKAMRWYVLVPRSQSHPAVQSPWSHAHTPYAL